MQKVQALTQSFHDRPNEKPESRNKTFSRQVFSLAKRSSFVSMRERRHAPESYSIQKRQPASATSDWAPAMAPPGSRPCRSWGSTAGSDHPLRAGTRAPAAAARAGRRLPSRLWGGGRPPSVETVPPRSSACSSHTRRQQQAGRSRKRAQPQSSNLTATCRDATKTSATPTDATEQECIAPRQGKEHANGGYFLAQNCFAGTRTTRPSSASDTLIWHERRLSGRTSNAKSSMSSSISAGFPAVAVHAAST